MRLRPTRVTPPDTAIQKLSFYGRKYGVLSAVARYVGRQSPWWWQRIGMIATTGHIRGWLATPGQRILNLGGGGNCMVECLTVDIDARADAYVDLTRPLPFPDQSVDGIFCEEVIEHLDRSAGSRLLAECRRILRLGGTLRLTTPNLIYFTRRIIADPADAAEINTIFYGHGHRHLYTPESLALVCQTVGFHNLRPSYYQDPQSNLGWLDSHADRFDHPPEESQYLDARE